MIRWGLGRRLIRNTHCLTLRQLSCRPAVHCCATNARCACRWRILPCRHCRWRMQPWRRRRPNGSRVRRSLPRVARWTRLCAATCRTILPLPATNLTRCFIIGQKRFQQLGWVAVPVRHVPTFEEQSLEAEHVLLVILVIGERIRVVP